MNHQKKIIELEQYLKSKNIGYDSDFQLSKISYLKIGGITPLFIRPGSKSELLVLIIYCRQNDIKIKLLGNASNCLFSETSFETVFISTKELKNIYFDDNGSSVTAEAGLMLPVFVKEVSEKGKTGFEGLAGIPGTIGGAVCMNSGAYGNEIKDNLIEVYCVDAKCKEIVVKESEAKFGFRHSMFQENKALAIIGAKFTLKNGNLEDIKHNIAKYQFSRNTYQERGYPNLGSLFKTKDIYSDIGRCHSFYMTLIRICRKMSIIYGNTNNKLLNYVTNKYFKIEYEGEKPFSDKTINCLVNRGDLNFNKAIEFIRQMKELLDNSVELEIEIIE